MGIHLAIKNSGIFKISGNVEFRHGHGPYGEPGTNCLQTPDRMYDGIDISWLAWCSSRLLSAGVLVCIVTPGPPSSFLLLHDKVMWSARGRYTMASVIIAE